MRILSHDKFRLNTMHAIQLHATQQQDFRVPKTVELQVASPLQMPEVDLDDALAVVLNTMRQSKNPRAMDALGTLLAYMETLEKKHSLDHTPESCVTLTNPITMTF